MEFLANGLPMPFLDGAYAFTGGTPMLRRAHRPSRDDLVHWLHRLSGRSVRLLERGGVLIAAEVHPCLDRGFLLDLLLQVD